MNVEQLRESGMIAFDAVAGSHAYGTNIPTSDIDYRGIFILPNDAYLSMDQPAKQVSDEKNDTTYYSLKRYFELTSKATPNTLELLWMPDETVQFENEAFKHLKANRDLFISKKCYYTFTGYAHAQIKKAKGQNKWVNNPQPKDVPNKFQFCWFIEADPLGDFALMADGEGHRREYLKISKEKVLEFTDSHGFPVRPRKLCGMEQTLLHGCHASKLEHCENVYRVYDYGLEGKGVFRGPNQQLVVESIPKEDEWTRFAGLLIYNENAHKAAVRDHKHYWEWVRNRNKARWVTQEAGEIDYDAKNMLHCVRLIKSGKSILETGNPIVRFEGKDLKFLMDIRKGSFTHEEIMEYCEYEMAELEKLYESSDIPKAVNQKKLNELYLDVRDIAFGK